MSTYADITEKATNQILEAIKPVEKLAASTFAQAVDGVSKLPSLPRPEGLPTALDVVSAHFAFAQRMLDAQKDFALGLASATPADATAKPKTAAKA